MFKYFKRFNDMAEQEQREIHYCLPVPRQEKHQKIKRRPLSNLLSVASPGGWKVNHSIRDK